MLNIVLVFLFCVCTSSVPFQFRNEWISTVQVRQFPPNRFPCQKIAVHSRLPLDISGSGVKYYLSNSTTDCGLISGFLIAITVDGFSNFTYVNLDCDGPVCAQEGMFVSLMDPSGTTSHDCFAQGKCDNAVLAFPSTQPILVSFLSPDK